MLNISASISTNNKMRGRLSTWLAKHKLAHRPLGFDYQGVETLQIKSRDWPSVAVAPYAYGSNYLRSQCAYDVAPGGALVSVYHLTRIQNDLDQPEELCIKVFVPREDPKIPSVFWIWKSADFQERESYDMLGITYENHPNLKRILMPDTWIGWPLRKDYIVPNSYELQDSLQIGTIVKKLLQQLFLNIEQIIFFIIFIKKYYWLEGNTFSLSMVQHIFVHLQEGEPPSPFFI